MHILEEKIRRAQQDQKYALVPFLTYGFPDRAAFWPTVAELDENGADIIEIGVPFSDPVADGPVVEAASRRALSEGVNLKDLLKELAERRSLFSCGIVLMGYYNPFLQYGLKLFAQDAAKAGVNGVIVPDLPLDESLPMRRELEQKDIALIALVGPNTNMERMKHYAQLSKGYAYVVSVMGVTGARESLPKDVCETLERAKSSFSIPVALGFGLTDPAQLSELDPKVRPDAVVFGSALLRTLDQGGSAAAFLRRWQN